MKKKLIILSSIILLIIIGLYFVSKNHDNRIKIASWLAVPSADFIENNKLRNVKVEFSEEDKIHF